MRSGRQYACGTDAVLQLPGSTDPLHGIRQRRQAAGRGREERRRAAGGERQRQPEGGQGPSADPAARADAEPGNAPSAGRRARPPRQPGDHDGPAGPRPLGPPARHVALLDGHLRRADRRPDGSPRARAGGRDGHLAGRQRGAGGGLPAPRATARDGDRDAGARQRPARERARLHAVAGGADLRGAGDEAGGERDARRAARRCCPTGAT